LVPISKSTNYLLFSSNILDMEINRNDLVVGIQYRIEHRRGLLLPRLGTFIQNYNFPTGIYSAFNNIIRPDGKENPTSIVTFDNIDWVVTPTRKNSIIAGQVARGLSGPGINEVTGEETRPAIPEAVAGSIHDFLVPGIAPIAFPERNTQEYGGARARTYLKRKVKKSRNMRKNKSKSRKNLCRK